MASRVSVSLIFLLILWEASPSRQAVIGANPNDNPDLDATDEVLDAIESLDDFDAIVFDPNRDPGPLGNLDGEELGDLAPLGVTVEDGELPPELDSDLAEDIIEALGQDAAAAAGLAGGLAASGAKVAGGTLKLQSSLVAPLFALGAKVTAPIVKFQAKAAAPFVLAGAALSKPLVKHGIRLAAPAIKLGQIASAGTAAVTKPLAAGLAEAFSPIEEAVQPLAEAIRPAEDAALLGLEVDDLSREIEDELDRTNIEEDLERLGEDARQFATDSLRLKLLGAEAVANGLSNFGRRNRREARYPGSSKPNNPYKEAEMDAMDVVEEVTDDSPLEDDGEVPVEEMIPEEFEENGSDLTDETNEGNSPNEDVEEGDNEDMGDDEADIEDNPDAMIEVEDEESVDDPEGSVSEDTPVVVVVPPESGEGETCQAYRSGLTTSECLRVERYQTRTCSKLDCSALNIDAIHERCQVSAPGVHCDQNCWSYEHKDFGTCFNCNLEFSIALSTTGQCRRLIQCYFGNKVCPNFQPSFSLS